MKLYILKHIYYNMYKEGLEEVMKPLGIYTSDIKAREAIKRYYKLPGFCEYSIECFEICEYKINEDAGWKEGFFNWKDEFSPPENFEVPYWAKDKKPSGMETALGYANRLMNGKYGENNWENKGELNREKFKILLRGYMDFGLELGGNYEK